MRFCTQEVNYLSWVKYKISNFNINLLIVLLYMPRMQKKAKFYQFFQKNRLGLKLFIPQSKVLDKKLFVFYSISNGCCLRY